MSLSVEQVIESYLHIGTLKKESNPKMRKYFLDAVNGTIILNPDKTLIQLNNAREKIAQAKKDGKEILVICEKSLYSQEIEDMSAKIGFHYLNRKVPSGFLTNYDTLIKRIRSMNEMRSFTETDEFSKLTKKEKSSLLRNLKKVEATYKGAKNLSKKPELVIVVDGKLMSGLISEIEKTGIDNIIIASSDFDRYWKDENLVVANVNSYNSLDMIMNYILSA